MTAAHVLNIACADCPADELGVSSLHMTFNQEAEAGEMARLGYLHRTGIQYHWCRSPTELKVSYPVNDQIMISIASCAVAIAVLQCQC
jgi:Peptidogalycan biosysnthesis/recognition